MAYITVDQSPRDRLAATRGVTIIHHPLPRDPAEIATVIAGVRCYAVRAEGGACTASFQIGNGEDLALADGVTEAAAFAAVLAHVALVREVPAHYSAINDQAEREAAATVLAAFAVPLPLVA